MFTRRNFLAASAASSLATLPGPAFAWNADPTRTVVGIMGLSRGLDLAKDLAKIPGVVIKYACDADAKRADSGAKRIQEMDQSPTVAQDFRTILDDPEVDALICAAPNHWHGPATILGCKAGKHVYVEKPCSHNPAEGEWMVAAAERYHRCVQMGTQRRSGRSFQEAISKLHQGAIGKCYLARTAFQRLRGTIGSTQPSDPPPHLRYDLWQGPAPKRPYRSNIVHYNWHWFWHYGNGELGNNGVHSLDVCRWGLQVDYPTRVVSSGGIYALHDDQETPDTQSVAFEFGDEKQITYQGTSRSLRAGGPFAIFYGTDGTMEITADGGYTVFNSKDEEQEKVDATGWGQSDHLKNFIDAIRSGKSSELNQPILEGHKSTLLCHLGNIAYRTGMAIALDSKTGRLLEGQSDAESLWQRTYDPEWETQITAP